jgi:8-amino-7-oxononanoate synthase
VRVAVEYWPSASHAVIAGRDYLAFAGCDYLGLSHDPDLLGVVSAGLLHFGLGANGSRETSGNTLTHELLEQTLASFIGTEASLLCPDGALANLAACQWFAQKFRVALVEARAHASLGAAARAAGMQVESFQRADLAALNQRLGVLQGAAVVITDTVFAADGALAPVRELVGLARDHGAGVLFDDCHGIGVLGEQGRGCYRAVGADHGPLIITATLAKALGCAGGVCAADAATLEGIRATAWAYRGTTPIPPALAAGALSVVERLASDSTLLGRLRANIQQLRSWFVRLGLPLPEADCPIFAFCPADEPAVTRLRAAFAEAGVWVPFIDYPGAAMSQYFRLALNAAHTQADIEILGRVLAEALARTPEAR